MQIIWEEKDIKDNLTFSVSGENFCLIKIHDPEYYRGEQFARIPCEYTTFPSWVSGPHSINYWYNFLNDNSAKPL